MALEFKKVKPGQDKFGRADKNVANIQGTIMVSFRLLP